MYPPEEKFKCEKDTLSFDFMQKKKPKKPLTFLQK